MSEQWQINLEKHDELRREGTVRLFDRMTLLVAVFEDPMYKEAMREEGKNALAELSRRVNDVCCPFAELWQMLKMFPSREQWETGDLMEMNRAMHERLRQGQRERREDGPGHEQRNRDRKLSWKEKYLELEAKYKDLLAKHEQLQRSHDQLVKAVGGKSRAKSSAREKAAATVN